MQIGESMKQIPWTRTKYDRFLELAILTDDEKQILESRVIKNASRVQQSMECQISLATVDRIIKSIREKYDQVQKEYPEEFELRKR